MDTKVCTKCKEEKTLKEFYQTNTTKDGYTYNCISCYLKYRKEHREHNKNYMANLRNIKGEEIKEYKKDLWKNMNPIHRMLQQARGRSKRRNIEFNLIDSDLDMPEFCPLLNCPFVNGKKDNYEQTPSLDRIDPNKGYIKGNVQILSKRANTMKNNATKEELITFALNILKSYKNDDIVQTIWKHIENQDKEPD